MPLIIVNPVCGDRSAPNFFADNVKIDGELVETTSAEHAGQVVAARLASESPLTVVLGSGDGTLHDIINALHPQPAAVNFVLVPCGTANALYSSLFPGQDDKLLSLDAFVSAKPPIPLSLATTTIASKVSVSSVVVSTSLHASILHDSEALRAAHPGIERSVLCAKSVTSSPSLGSSSLPSRIAQNGTTLMFVSIPLLLRPPSRSTIPPPMPSALGPPNSPAPSSTSSPP